MAFGGAHTALAAAVPIHRDEEDQLVVSPATTGGVTLVVVDRAL